ncbi:acetyl-CoA synthetase-like protein, partial [Anaeromyces robustus]
MTEYYYTLFQKIAENHPNKTAIVFKEKTISYKELDEMSNSLGHYIRKNGVKRNDIIPIITERSFYFIISTLAISKAGAAFLPIDINLPSERIEYILEEVKPKLILTNYSDSEQHKEILNKYKSYNIKLHNYKENTESLSIINEYNDYCYVLFTSGTTGKPKGTILTHLNIYNYLRSYPDNTNSLYNIMKENGINNALGITNFTFDIYHNEITYCLSHGLSIILVDEKLSENINDLTQYIDDNNVDFINTTPSRFKLFMENNKFRNVMKNIKVLIFIGEDLPLSLYHEIIQYTNSKVYNGYGPTECTVTCSYKLVQKNEITVGTPITNNFIYILDNYLKPVPIGVEGEIYIGGSGVGEGYLHREELTNEKFINSPFFIPSSLSSSSSSTSIYSQKLYSTGDLGKWSENGEIIFVGRNDFQVKINGQRVELSEIENIIKKYPEIIYAVIIYKKNIDNNNNNNLICYYKTNSNKELNENDLKEFVSKQLPSYMCPNYYMRLNEIPLSPSGKLNRKALPEIDISKISKNYYIPPETETERVICNILQNVLKLKENEIGKKTDFVELGINSLNSIRFSAEIENKLNIKISIKDILSHSKVDNLSKYIDELRNENDELHQIEIIQKNDSKIFPITSQQLGIYIDCIKNPNSTTYNVPVSLILKENIDMKKLERALQYIFTKNNILRSKYYEKQNENGENIIYGEIDETATLTIQHYTKETITNFVRPFKLDEAPLVRVAFIENEILLMDFHHIIVDGISISILIQQLNKFYHNIEGDSNSNYIQYIQFSDYAFFHHEKKQTEKYEEQLHFYKEMFLDEEYDSPNLPKRQFNNNDHNDNKLLDENHGTLGSYEKLINSELSHKINEYIKVHGVSQTSFFISIYSYLLSKYSNQNSVYTSIINNNRNNHFTQDMIGMFVTTQPILFKINEEQSFDQYIKENTNILYNLYDIQHESLAGLMERYKLKKLNNCFV